MNTVSFGGVQVRVLFGLSAMERIEDTCGGMHQLRQNMKKPQLQRRTILQLYDAMTACAGDVKPQDALEIVFIREMLADTTGKYIPIYYEIGKRVILSEMSKAMQSSHTQAAKQDRYTKAVNNRMAQKQGKKDAVDSRIMYSRALIAGVTYTEARTMWPGLINDLYTMRVEHDLKASPLAHMGMAMGRRKARKGR